MDALCKKQADKARVAKFPKNLPLTAKNAYCMIGYEDAPPQTARPHHKKYTFYGQMNEYEKKSIYKRYKTHQKSPCYPAIVGVSASYHPISLNPATYGGV